MVVIYAENRSFDHLYGMFPGAEGIADASAEQKTQLDHDGRPLPFLPPVYAHGRPDARYPIGGMPNGPFRIDAPPINGRLDAVLPSPWHLYYQNREQINGGKNNMFVAVSNVGGWVMGYFDGSRMKLWSWAREYTLADGRQDPKLGRSVIYARGADSPMFQPHHQPFNYYARFAPGTRARAAHLKDEKDFLDAIHQGTLPAVAFYKPAGRYTEHPSYTDLMSGDEHIAMLLERLRASPQWKRMAVFVTYDENGGFWDHVPPPSGPGWGDRWGPGTRIPAIIVSPYAKRGYVDKTPYDTTSILKFITERFGLAPLPGVRAKAGDLSNAFAF